MSFMFRGAVSFNQNIGSWNTQAVTSVSEMFNGATAFDQDIGNWNVSNVTDFSNFMASKTNLNYSAANLDSIYNGWSSLPSLSPNESISFGTIKYNASAQAGKDILTNAPNNWTITDGGVIFDADYQAVLNYGTTQGYTLPSAGQQDVAKSVSP
jgi:surface protein